MHLLLSYRGRMEKMQKMQADTRLQATAYPSGPHIKSSDLAIYQRKAQEAELKLNACCSANHPQQGRIRQQSVPPAWGGGGGDWSR